MFMNNFNNTGYIHFTMAAMFFVSLSYMSIINFRRTEDMVSFGKGKQDNTYRLCGIGMLICLVLIFVYNKWLENKFVWLDNLHPVFCLEATALIFFGISFVKYCPMLLFGTIVFRLISKYSLDTKFSSFLPIVF